MYQQILFFIHPQLSSSLALPSFFSSSSSSCPLPVCVCLSAMGSAEELYDLRAFECRTHNKVILSQWVTKRLELPWWIKEWMNEWRMKERIGCSLLINVWKLTSWTLIYLFIHVLLHDMGQSFAFFKNN